MSMKARLSGFLLEDPNNSDMVKLIEVEDQELDKRLQNVLYLKEQLDIDTMEDRFLWYKLKERGWGSNVSLDYNQQRDLLRYITLVLKGRGWMPSIVDTVYLLFGVELSFRTLDAEALGYWRIGYSKLGIDTKIGVGDDGSSTTEIILDVPSAVSQSIRGKIVQIAEYLRPATKQFIYRWIADTQVIELQGFIIGKCKIGLKNNKILLK
jgi:hypothetical protein